MERFNARRRKRRLLRRIDAAYRDGLDEDERLMLEKMRRMQERLAEGDWE
jgi:hypothetical protein